MKAQHIISNGTSFVFHVIQNTTTPCPQCGVPACGRTDILWYEEVQQRKALFFDGGHFDLALETLFKEALSTTPYEALPHFLQAWQEDKDWADCWDYEGYPLVIDDFLMALKLLQAHTTGQWISLEELTAMQTLATLAQEKSFLLKIVRG